MQRACAMLLGCLLVWTSATGFAMAQPTPPTFPTTTVIVHGFTTGSKGAWVQGMAQAILARAGEGSLYRYEGSTGAWTYVPTSQGNGTNNVVVLIFNWVPESASPSPGPNWNYAQAAGDVLYTMLRSPRYAGQSGPSNLVANRTLHFIGHSRGTCVNSEAIRRLALAGIPVDQFTALDPHPVNGTLDPPYDYNWGDPVPQKWDNVTWADNYWRADGGGIINGLDFDGIPLANVFNTQLSESALNCCGYGFSHSDVHLWCHGTIDLSPTPCDGEQCINAQMRSTWWPEGYTQRGFYYTALGGGSGQRPGPLPPGSAPGVIETIINGGFELGSYAGWGYHGGSVAGQIVLESGNGYLKLGAGVGGGGAAATHNLFYLPANASAISLDYRVITASAVDLLRVTLTNQQGGGTVLGSIALSNAGGWIANQTFPLGCSLPRGRAFTLTLQIVAPAGGAVGAVVGIDNVHFTTSAAPAADVTGDGLVTVDDLLAVINAWGACPSPCPPFCRADITHDCSVNVDDLLAIINGWGQCS